MTTLFRRFFLLLALGSFGLTQAQPKPYYKRQLDICELSYEDGNYRQALTYSERLLKKISKSTNTEDTLARPVIYLHQAKYLEAMARYEQFETKLKDALSLLKKRGDRSLAFTKGLIQAADLYLEYSDVVSSENYYTVAKRILDTYSSQKGSDIDYRRDSWFEAQMLHLAASIAYEEGNYRKAEEVLPKLLELKKARITNQETYYDIPTESFLVRKLNRSQVKLRKLEYARELILKAKIARDKGAYTQADSLFAFNADWIKSNLHPTSLDVASVENTHEYIKQQIILGKVSKEMLREIEKNLFKAERTVGLVHKSYLRVHEALIQNYTEMQYSNKGKKQLWELKTNTQRYYSDESLPYAVYERLEAKRRFYSRSNSILGGIKAAFSTREGILDKAQESLVELHNDIQKIPLNHHEQVEVLDQLYRVSLALNQIDSAQSYLDQSLELREKIYGKESLPYHLAKITQADYYLRYSNQPKKVKEILDESFHEYIETRLLPNSVEYINALDEYAYYYSLNGQFDSASIMANRAVELMAENVGDSHPLYAQTLEQMVKLELEQGEFKEANSNIDTLLNIYQEAYRRHSPYAFHYAQALSTAANYYATVGLYGEAKNTLNRSERYMRRGDASQFDPVMQENRLSLLIKTEKLKQAERLVLETIEQKTKVFGENSRLLIDPYLFKTSIYLIDGDYIGAREMVEKAYEITKSTHGERSYKATQALTLRAEVLTAIGSYNLAISDLKLVIDIIEETFGEDHIQLAAPYLKLGLATFFNDETQVSEAKDMIKKGADLYAKSLGEDSPAYAVALKTLAQVYIASGELEEAEKDLIQAANIWKERLGTEVNSNSAEIALLLGDVRVKRKNYETAQVQYESGRKLYAKLFSKQHPGYVQAIGRLGRVHYMQKNYRLSLKYIQEALDDHYRIIEDFFPAMSEGEKARFWQKIRVDFEFFNTLAVVASNNKPKLLGEMYNNIINTKAILLGSSIKVRNNILSSNNPQLIATYEEWEALKEQLIEELSLSPEQLKEEGLDPKSTQREIDRLEKELGLLSKEFSQSQQASVVSWKEVANNLEDNEVAVEIVRFRHFEDSFTDSVVYMALVLAPKEPRPLLIPIDGSNDLETKFLKYYRACIEYKIDDEQSYNNYWRAIDQVLSKGSKVYFSGEGVYNQINLEAVRADDGEYVIDHSDITLVTSTKELYTSRTLLGDAPKGEKADSLQQTLAKQKNVLLLGNPAFYKDLKEEELLTYNNRDIIQLKGTQEEVIALNELLSEKTSLETTLKINWDATESYLKSIANPEILHIATHGYFEPDSKTSDSELAQERASTSALLRSGLLFTHAGDLMANGNIYEYNKEPGILTAYEATSLRLDSTELVVLSACETARGEVQVGEGVFGLQRAFLLAGADAIIMSLFKVNDEATKKFMIYFYSNWKIKMMDKRKAFIEAKKQLREEYPDPIFWGPFIMVGSI